MGETLCVLCEFCKMKKKICGTYCKFGHVNDGNCPYYIEYRRHKRKSLRSDSPNLITAKQNSQGKEKK